MAVSCRLALLVALFIGVASANVEAQRRTITGRVTDQMSGQPISGAQIIIRGTNTGTLGRADGTFSLPVPAGPVTLVVTFIGYRRAEVSVAATQASVTIPMQVDVLRVDEIVVTGQATGVSRRNLANSVAKVSSAELVKAPASSVEQSLMGKVASAMIQDLGGGPGGGVLVRLRGTTSLNNAYTPLYVVDGVIVSDAKISRGINRLTQASTNANTISTDQEQPVGRIADLNPDAIESIEVLKGAAASAIYGSKASNGVILITTKKGNRGAPKFTVAQRLGSSAMMRPVGFRVFHTLAEAVDAFGPDAANYFQTDNVFNHDDELAGEKPLHFETAATMSGGSESTRYFASALVRHEGGIIRSTFADKQSLRLNLDQNLGNRVQLALSSEVLHTANDRGITGNGNAGVSYYDALTTTPSFVDLRAVCPDGSRQAFCEGGVYPRNPFANSNPLATVDLVSNDESVWRGIVSGRAQVEALNTPQHSVRLVVNGGVDNFSQKNNVFSPPELQYEGLDGLLGTRVLTFGAGLNINLNTNAVYKFTPTSGLLTGTTSIGLQYETRDQQVSRTLSEGLVGGLELATAGTSIKVDEEREKVNDLGLFAQEEILVKERLLLTLGARMDKSSNNSDVEKWFFYPKAAASYRMSPFPGKLDELKLRAAVGVAGNQPQYRLKFSDLEGRNLAGSPVYRIAEQVAASDIRPERQREIEIGFDATLLNNRASLEVTAYDKNITDLLLRRNLPPVTGFTRQIFNGGVMRTRGLEVGLSAFPVQNTTWRWNPNINFFLSRSKILDLPVPTFRVSTSARYGTLQIEEGKSPTQVIAWVPGPDGTGRADAVIGDYNPDYKLGFSNNLGFKKLNLYFMIDHLQGGWIHNYTELLYDYAKNTKDYVENGEARIAPGETNCSACAWMQPTTNTKLREATLSFEMPLSITQKIYKNAQSMRVSLSGRNLLTITDYRGGDPEVLVRAATLFTQWRSDIWPYPPFRTFWASVEMTF